MAGSPSPAATQLHRTTHVIAFADAKGGVGKTSLTANIGATLAELGERTLLISLDPQDNIGEDLGYTYGGPNREGLSDDGAALIAALLHGEPLHVPLKGVRPNLDVVPSGPGAGEDLVVDMVQAGRPMDALAQALLGVSDDYDFILMDCPPFSRRLQRQAFVAAQHLIIPTSPDPSARKGIAGAGRAAGMLEDYVTAQEANPDLNMLGVILFDALTANSAQRKVAILELNRQLTGMTTVFQNTIRTAVSPATEARRRGLTALELARLYQPGYKHLTGEAKDVEKVPSSAGNLAEDYMSVTAELLARIGYTPKAHA